MKDIQQGLAVRTAFSVSCSWLAFSLLLAFAPAARAGDPTSNAFRKLANSAEKDVRSAVNAQVVVVKAALKAALAGYVSGDTQLPEAMHAAVAAVSSSVSRYSTAMLDEGTGLATAGADLLADFVGQVGEDFLDGGGGAWDRFKERSEGLAHKADLKLEREFGKFLRGVAKQAKKQGFDPDTRWRLCGHNPLLLEAVPGPVLASPSTSPSVLGGPQVQAMINIEARYLTVSDNFLQDIGVACSPPRSTRPSAAAPTRPRCRTSRCSRTSAPV